VKRIPVIDHVKRTLCTAATALKGLRRNKLRSGLTALGIIVGVFSVIAMMAVGDAAQATIQARVAALGENLLIVFAGNRRSGGANAGLGTASTITLSDAEAIRLEVTDVVAVSPEVTTSAQAITNGRNWSTNIVGESPEFLRIRSWGLKSGSMFNDRDIRGATKVAIIGAKTAHELFGFLDPLGQTVRLKNIPFIIIGALAEKGAGIGNQNQDDRIIVPFTTAMKRLTGDKYLRSINVQIGTSARMVVAQQQLTLLLRQRHRLLPGSEDDFSVLSQKEIADTVNAVSSALTLLLGAVAGMSLLVGGIGIMNIMLVSVTERTREIGIRIAVGARPADIRGQFLIESVTLCLIGGASGIVLGFGASALVAAFTRFTAPLSASSIVIALGVSFVIGIAFGFYPARRAAALDPIDALRYE
jgi:putative ABC transport system permease protein